MEKFLTNKALEINPDIFKWEENVTYAENINDDVDDKDTWLKNGTSYIWKVAVLIVSDSNKCDYVNVFIGHQRVKGGEEEFIGHLYWRDGENDDIGRCVRRYVNLLNDNHHIFEDR